LVLKRAWGVDPLTRDFQSAAPQFPKMLLHYFGSLSMILYRGEIGNCSSACRRHNFNGK
jgi:hypothetical protein